MLTFARSEVGGVGIRVVALCRDHLVERIVLRVFTIVVRDSTRTSTLGTRGGQARAPRPGLTTSVAR